MSHKPRALRFKAVGDVCFADIEKDPFVHVAHDLKADLLFCNLECCLTDRETAVPKKVNFRAAQTAADFLAAHQFNIISLANNHTLDFGPEALEDTLDALHERNLRYVGAGRSADEAVRELRFESGGVRVAVLASADATGGRAGGPAISVLNMKALRGLVALVRRSAEFVIVSYHGGIELDTVPSPFVIRSLRSLVDAGAHVVLGHHPHVVQPVEMYRGRVVAYSLGNFVFDNSRYGDKAALASRSIILEVNAEWNEGRSGGSEPRLDFACVPVKLKDDRRPHPVDGSERLEFSTYMDGLSASLEKVRPGDADVRRVENLTGALHEKSVGTIVRYAVRHIGDFSAAEIVLGIRTVLRHAIRRMRGRGRKGSR